VCFLRPQSGFSFPQTSRFFAEQAILLSQAILPGSRGRRLLFEPSLTLAELAPFQLGLALVKSGFALIRLTAVLLQLLLYVGRGL